MKTTKQKNDFYPTADWATVALIDFLEDQKLVKKHYSILEPCAGDGAISNVFERLGYTGVVTNDIDPTKPTLLHSDYLDPNVPFNYYRLIVTNPPYSIPNPNGKKSISAGHLFVEKALRHADVVAMMLRKSYTEPCKNRQEHLKNFRPYLYGILNLELISFVGGGKDQVAADWFIYAKEPYINRQNGLVYVDYINKSDYD